MENFFPLNNDYALEDSSVLFPPSKILILFNKTKIQEQWQ